jgi:glycosyltransferase involved in cell wall biosynthesis
VGGKQAKPGENRMDSIEQTRDERGAARRLTARFATLWAEQRRLAERLAAIESSTTWKVARRLAQWRRRLAPEGSRRQTCFHLCLRGLCLWRREGIKAVSRRIAGKLLRRPAEPAVGAIDEAAPAQTSARFFRGPARAGALPAPEGSKFRVVYVGSGSVGEAASMRYRAHHLVEALALVGVESTFVSLEEVPAKLPTVLSHDLIVLIRMIYNDTSAALIESARQQGLPIVYDIDDYIFDPWVMPYVEALHTMSQTDALCLMDALGACLDQCDYFTGSTSYLAEQAAALGKKSFVIRNGLNAAQLLLSRLARKQRNARPRDPYTRIGYFSGSRTHQADFRIVYPALMSLLREESNVRLAIVGHLDVGRFPGLALFMDQIETLPVRHWSELPAVIAGVDINLIPLELTPFNEGKSNLKYYEAALLQAPSIASPTRINRDNITHGHNGLLARTPKEWHDALKDLVSDAERRQRMGRHAFQHVLRNYVPRAVAAEAVEVYRQILHSHGRTRGAIRQAG